jgi:hypothetical protein
MVDMNIEVDEKILPQNEQRAFKVKGADGKTLEVVVRLAFGSDLIESMKGSNKKVSPTEQFFAMAARVTTIDGRSITTNDLRRLPLRAVQKITKEFNVINGADPLEDLSELTGEES